MYSPTAFQNGFNMLQVGALRMPFLFAQMNAALLVGEIALRVLQTTLHQVFGINGESPLAKKVAAWAPNGTGDILRPYGDQTKFTYQKLALGAISCAVIGNVGAAVVSAAFGKAPEIYNIGLSLLGSIRITDARHPLINYLVSCVHPA